MATELARVITVSTAHLKENLHSFHTTLMRFFNRVALAAHEVADRRVDLGPHHLVFLHLVHHPKANPHSGRRVVHPMDSGHLPMGIALLLRDELPVIPMALLKGRVAGKIRGVAKDVALVVVGLVMVGRHLIHWSGSTIRQSHCAANSLLFQNSRLAI